MSNDNAIEVPALAVVRKLRQTIGDKAEQRSGNDRQHQHCIYQQPNKRHFF